MNAFGRLSGANLNVLEVGWHLKFRCATCSPPMETGARSGLFLEVEHRTTVETGFLRALRHANYHGVGCCRIFVRWNAGEQCQHQINCDKHFNGTTSNSLNSLSAPKFGAMFLEPEEKSLIGILFSDHVVGCYLVAFPLSLCLLSVPQMTPIHHPPLQHLCGQVILW